VTFHFWQRKQRMFRLISLYAGGHDDAMFVRPERQSDGRRTFKLHPGEPEPTSYGADLYRQVFGDDSASGPGANPAAD